MIIDGYSHMGKGDACDVWIKPKAFKDSKSARKPDRAKAQLILVHIRDLGTADVPDDGFKDEGKHPSGVAGLGPQHVFAVSAGQLRLYCGFIGAGQLCLVATEAIIKKTQKANQQQLRRVAREIGRLNDEYGKSV